MLWCMKTLLHRELPVPPAKQSLINRFRQVLNGILAGAFVLAATAAAQNRTITWRGQELLLSGCNVAWENYGTDFAMVEEWGNYCSYDHAATETMFANLAAAGCNCVRWWVFCDGRGGPEFDADSGGNVTGLDVAVLSNMEDAINLAADYGIYLVFCLWDFGMLFDDSTPLGRGEHAGGHRDLVVDATARGTFTTNGLLPILQHPVTNTSYTIATHPNVLAWEIINEPEWGIVESEYVDTEISQPVSLAQMQEFTAVLAGVIHRHANQQVTLGSACLKWNSDTALGAVGNWWKDSALTAYDPDGALDFYQIHYYGWMNGDYTTWSYSPMFNDTAAASLDKPTVIGEFPANGDATTWTVEEIINGCFSNGYCGAWSWTYMGNDDHGDWSHSVTSYQGFGATHADQIRPPPGFDRDGDGLPDTAEFTAGTDPGNRGSFLAVVIRDADGGLEVSLDTVATEGTGYGGVNRYYAIEESISLTAGAWHTVQGFERIAGTNGVTQYRPPGAASGSRYYRAQVWLENR